MSRGQTPPSLPGYRKLVDFVHNQQQGEEQHFPEMPESSFVPRMKLPAVDTSTGEISIPWVLTWSQKAAVPPDPHQVLMGQPLPYTPQPEEILCEMETLRIPVTPYGDSISQGDGQINTSTTQNSQSEFEETKEGLANPSIPVSSQQSNRTLAFSFYIHLLCKKSSFLNLFIIHYYIQTHLRLPSITL